MRKIIVGHEVARLRTEGSGVVMFIPRPVQEELCWAPGDLLLVKPMNGCLVARKVNLDDVIRDMKRGIEETSNSSDGGGR